jgi:hypothetical protein
MSTRPTDTQESRSRNGDATYRVVILANEVIGDEALVQEILRHTKGREAEVRIVAPATVKSPLDLATGDVDDDIDEARRRLDASIDALQQHGIKASGDVGEADPNLALEDALRRFRADEVIIVVHPRERQTWLEQDVVDRARRELTVPITYIEVDGADSGSPGVRDVKEIEPHGDQRAADIAQASFESDYLPPMPRRDRAALIVGPLGTIALALLAIDCAGQFDIGAWDPGCFASWVGGVYAFIVTAIHVPAILVLQGERYAGGLRNFMSISVLVIVPLLVLIAAIAVLLS